MTPEGAIKKAMREWLEDNSIWYTNVQGGAFVTPGAPDIIAVVDGRFLGIEAKTKTGRLREDQKICRDAIEASGGTYIVARSVEDVMEAVAKLRQTV